jgi:YihY family inner membrane protein
MFPMILGALSIVGLAIRDPGAELRFQSLILQTFPGNAQAELQSAIHGVRQSAGWMGLVSLGGLIWSASGIFSTMEFALTQIFGTRQRDLLRQKLMGLVMMVMLVVALGVTVAANWGAGYLSPYLPYAWVLGFLVGALVMIVLLVLLYRFVPNRTFSVREVLPGALLAGVLIAALSILFPLYARFAGGFNTYGAQFGLFFVLATWLYLLSELLLLGAVYNRFRLGEPDSKGLIASPSGRSRDSERPVDVISRKRVAVQDAPATPEGGVPSRSHVQRGLLAVAVGLAVAGGAARRAARRGRRNLA